MTDNNKYLNDLGKKVQEHVGTHNARKDAFVNATDTDSEKDALNNLSVLVDADAIAKAEKILKDDKANTALRTTTLNKLINAIGESEALITYVIGLIGNKSIPVELRRAAILVLETLTFSSQLMVAKQPDFFAALRGVVEDKNQSIREEALTYLAQHKDEYAQRCLLAGLTDESKALVSEEKAVNLVGYDIHAGVYPVLKKVIEQSSSTHSRAVAVNLLAGDSGSKDLLVKLFKNKKEPQDLRISSGLALNTYYPSEFTSLAKDVVLDDKEDADLQAVCINALAHSNDNGAYNDASIDAKLESYQTKEGGPEQIVKASDHYFKNKAQ